jgi:arylsulfatase A-like enzyme
MGEGVEPGRVDDPVAPLDLAPTMAAWAGIPYPDDLDGRALVRK